MSCSWKARRYSTRWRYALIHTYKPVLDDASYRAFDTTEDYRHWCEQNPPTGSAMPAVEYRQGEEVLAPDLVLCPDGLERFEDAWQRRIEV